MILRNTATATWLIPLSAKAYLNGRLVTNTERRHYILTHDIIRFNYPGKLKIEYDPKSKQSLGYGPDYFEIVQKGSDYFEVWQYITEFEKLMEQRNFELLVTTF